MLACPIGKLTAIAVSSEKNGWIGAIAATPGQIGNLLVVCVATQVGNHGIGAGQLATATQVGCVGEQ